MRFSRIAVMASLIASSTAVTASGVTVFFQNDGNWSTHATKPSALFVNEKLSHADAVETCASYNETLLSCKEFPDFEYQFTYQQYLDNIDDDQLFWSSCDASNPVTWTGSLSESSTASEYPFLCTNNAPFVNKVDVDFTPYSRINTTVNGTTFQGVRDHMALRFMGIPYAQPPVDDLRFKYAEEWNGTFVDATHYSAGCLQYGYFDGNSYGLNPWGNSEDCLYLNVFTSSIPSPSANSSNSLKPVMFWMHGGSQTTGTGSDSTFDGDSLVSRSDVVLVTINYRLNIFGYLTLADDVITGNYALTDKIAALEWVHKYISGFGGDPNNITIFGQSAGGGSVIDLITSPKAAGLFQGGILQSAGRGHDTAVPATAAAEVLPYLTPLCNSTGEERLKCLQDLPAETLLNITYSEVPSWQTAVDGIYTLDIPISQIAKGRPYINTIKYMGGFMPEEAQALLETTLSPNATSFNATMQTLVEAGTLVQEQADAIIASNLWLVTNETVHNSSTTYSNVYNASVNAATDAMISCFGAQFHTVGAAVNAWENMWIYEHQRGYGLNYYDFYDLCTFPVGEPETPYYRCHSSDLYEVFGTYYLFDLPVRVDEDIHYTNAVQDMWASFARTGNPNVDKEYLEARGYNSTLDLFSGWQWPRFTSYSPRVASIGYSTPGYTSLPNLEQCDVIVPWATL